VQFGYAKGDHEAGAVPVAHAPPVAHEHPADDLGVAIHEPPHRKVLELARQFSGPHHVAKDDREDVELLGWRSSVEPLAAVRAEPLRWDDLVPATRTCRHALSIWIVLRLEPLSAALRASAATQVSSSRQP
jgi:hypothetical protein